MFTRFFITLSILLSSSLTAFADKIGIGKQPTNSILSSASGWSVYDFLAFVEGFLLKVVLPLTIIGTALYVALKLFLAEGNEEENKKAWKAVTYAAIGIISIMLAYAVIAIVQRLSL